MRYLHRLGGALAAGGPLLVLVASRIGALPESTRDAWSLGPLLLAVVWVSCGGLLLPSGRRLARALVLAGGVLFCAHMAEHVIDAPAVALALLSGLAAALYLSAPPVHHDASSALQATNEMVVRVRACGTTALGGGVALALFGSPRPAELAAVAASLTIAWLVAVLGLWQVRAALPRRRLALLAAACAVSIGLAAMAWGEWAQMLLAWSLGPCAALVLLRRQGPSTILRAFVDAVLSHPARLLVVTFFVLCTAGALLLNLPPAATPGRSISAIDAAFTATSAVCVTGLIVLDTPVDFSRTGQFFLLLLIQLGGLGIMSFSTAAIALLGRRFSLRHEAAVADLLAHHRGEMFLAVRRLLSVTFGVELCGALLLWPQFVAAGDGVATGLWRGVFTAVSAFCNAGFALQSDNLVSYARAPGVLHVVAMLIVLGGLSPAVILALPRLARRRPVAVQARLVLMVTLVLLAGGTLLVGAIEWSHSLGELSRIDRVHNAWFQAVVPRTAGFNSVDFATMRPATVWIVLALMFIGGSPGSTAGGVKTTTVAVLFIAVRSAMRARWEALVFGKRLAVSTVYKAAALTTLAATAVVAAVLALAVTQALPLDLALFEVVSALGTVGLSLGATPLLDDVGKVIIIACMFLGRVGPLTLFLFLRERHSEVPWRLPEAELDVG